MPDAESPILGWRVFFTRRNDHDLQPNSQVELSPDGLNQWLDEQRIVDGSPFLIGPDGQFDVDIDVYFTTVLKNRPLTTQSAVAYDLTRFLNFLWRNRNRTDWRDARRDDRAAFKHWRVTDPQGPHVALSTWDREVATVSQFYRWAVTKGHTQFNPFILRESRVRHPRRSGAGERTPAEASHSGRRHDIEWIPPQSYRRWRDVGVRGFTTKGLPDASFRGGFASRNAAFCDLMIRTGLRLSEQTSLSLFELPDQVVGMRHLRSWLPPAIAKGGSSRRIYVPASVLKDVWDYVKTDRADAIDMARQAGTYRRVRQPLVVRESPRPHVVVDGQRLTIAKLGHAERRRLFIDGADGLEPAALWLNRFGLPSHPSGWQQVFDQANARCARLGMNLRCHPHMLRHSFAVITLEQLWRGHIHEMAERSPRQRETYQMVFGDPLNWVRMRLGHASIETTQVYLHTLQELEMQTRMALVPDDWEIAEINPADAAELGTVDV